MKNAKTEVAEFVIAFITFFIFIDVVGFLLWASSGQRPPDDCYIGTVTAHVIMYATAKN